MRRQNSNGLPLGVFLCNFLARARKLRKSDIFCNGGSKSPPYAKLSGKNDRAGRSFLEKEMILAENLFSLYKILNKLSRVFCGTRFAVLESLRIFRQKKQAPVWVPVFFGGEGEIRTLEPISGLHDFQSCALVQLRDFSVLCCSQQLVLYHAYFVLSISKIKK